MCVRYLWFAAILLHVSLASAVSQLPDYLKRCNINVTSQQFNECLKGAIEDGFAKLKKGDPSIKVQELDPLKIDKIIVSKSLGLISLDVNQKDAEINGFSDGIQMDKLDMNFRKKEFSGSILASKLILRSHQILKGRIIGIPLSWRGNMECNITRVKCNFNAPFRFIHKDGQEHIQFNPSTIKLTLVMDHVRVHHIPNSPKDKPLANAADTLINENWKLVFGILKPSYEDLFRKELGKALVGVFSTVPLKEIFIYE